MTGPGGPGRIRVALGGPMAVGKSTVGRHLAAAWGVPFVDLDAQLGDIPAIFAAEGEAGFRARERQALEAAVAGAGVLALGGGTLVDPRNRERLAAWRVLILLARPETLAARLEPGGRPLAARWRELLQERAPVWALYGEPVWTDGLDVAEVADKVRARC